MSNSDMDTPFPKRVSGTRGTWRESPSLGETQVRNEKSFHFILDVYNSHLGLINVSTMELEKVMRDPT